MGTIPNGFAARQDDQLALDAADDDDLGRSSVGYWIVPSARGRRFAKTALATLSAWGLTLLGVHRLELYVEPWNEGSWRAAEHAGYQREGLLRSWEFVGDDRRDMFIHSQLPSPNAANAKS